MSLPHRWTFCISLLLFVLLESPTGYSSKSQTAQEPEGSATTTAPKTDHSLQSEDSATPEYSLNLPSSFGRWTGDWDVIEKHNLLRLLVLYNRTGFFYDKGRPRGMVPDISEELECYLNKKLNTGAKKFRVAFIPVPPAQLRSI
jgi:hypothetical protein